MSDVPLTSEIEEKLTALPDAAKQEVLDFIDFLAARQPGTKERSVVEETKFWQSAGSGPLGRIWDNTEDDVYAELLES
jgi:hypothetical protein